MSDLRFLRQQLSNGLVIIGEQNPRAQTVAAGYFVRTGARDEPRELAGVSHFLEHMMFKGTTRRSAEDINREFDEIGARYNAYTSEERTVYYGAVLPLWSERLIDLLTDMMRPALRVDDFELEKKVVLEEIAMYRDRPHFRVLEEGNRLFFNSHPLGNAVLGSVETIAALERQQMLEYFIDHYAPDNILLVLAGAFDWQVTLRQVETLTAEWQPRETTRTYPPFIPRDGRAVLEDSEVARAHIALYAPGVAAQDDARYAAAILASCIGDDRGSRLFWSLIDKGFADAASFSHDGSDHLGAYIGYISTSPDQVEAILETVNDVFSSVQREGVTPDEWRRAQRKLATALTLRGETPFGRLMSLGVGYQYTERYRGVAEVIEAIHDAALEDGLELLASQPFTRLFTVILTPEALSSL